jgi:hypothetical protein
MLEDEPAWLARDGIATAIVPPKRHRYRHRARNSPLALGRSKIYVAILY